MDAAVRPLTGTSQSVENLASTCNKSSAILIMQPVQ